MKTDALLNSDNVFIDVDEIINKYNSSNDTKTLVGEEIWSEPIDVFSSNKHKESIQKNSLNIIEKGKSVSNSILPTMPLAPNSSNTRAMSLDDIEMTSKLNLDANSSKINHFVNTSRLDLKSLDNISLKNTKIMKIKERPTIDSLSANQEIKNFLDKKLDVRLNDIEEKLAKTNKLETFPKPQSINPINIEQTKLDFLDNEIKSSKKINTKILAKTQSLNGDKSIMIETKSLDMNKSQLDEMYSNFETSVLNNSVVFSSKEPTNNLKKEIVDNNNVSKILFNDTNTINNELTKQINDAENISFNQQVLEKKIGFWTSRSISKEKKEKNKLQTKGLIRTLPRFYRFEYLYIKLMLVLFTVLATISIATLTYVLIQIFSFNQSTWLLLPQGFFNLFSFGLMIFAIRRLFYIKKEIKINNYTIGTEKSTPYIKKIYRSLSTSCILLNWLAASIYIVVIAGIILTFVVSYFYNLINDQINQFGLLSLDNGRNIVPLICVWTFASCGIFFIIWQVVANILNNKRRNEIELFYQQELISDELVQKYRKAATVKGMIIFFSITIAITVVGLLVWLVLKRKALKK